MEHWQAQGPRLLAQSPHAPTLNPVQSNQHILTGPFGRAALLFLTGPLTTHAHEHCHLILKVDGPDQTFVVMDRHFPLNNDHAVLVNPWQAHSYEPQNLETASRYLALYLDPHWLRERDAVFAKAHMPDFFRTPSAPITVPTRALAHDVCDMLQDTQVTAEEADHAILQLMLEITRPRARSDVGRRVRDYRIRRAQEFMKSRVEDPFDYDEVARIAGLSRSRFNALFRETVGVAPAIYGNAIRFEAAAAALATESNAQDVAFDLGFSSAGNFNRFFQNHTGVTPARYRRSMQCLTT